MGDRLPEGQQAVNYLGLRVWFMVSITLALAAVIASLVWEVTIATAAGTMVIMVLVILATLGIYALILYFTIKPSLKKLKSLHVKIWGTLIITALLVGGIIHFVRFVPSPEAALPISIAIASLLLAAGVSGYLLTLWVIWFTRKV